MEDAMSGGTEPLQDEILDATPDPKSKEPQSEKKPTNKMTKNRTEKV